MIRVLLLAAVLLAGPKKPDVPVPEGFWQKLPPPKDGEWLDLFREEGETFAEYKEAGPVRPTPTRTRLYLLPCLTRPPADETILEVMRLHLEAHFGRPAALLPPAPLPLAAYDAEARQYSVPHLVPSLLKCLPKDGIFVLAVTDRDLTLPKMTHVYGWGSLRLRVGVLSLNRIEVGKDMARFRRRVLGLMAHEAGHLLSMAHCTFYRCLMNGSRTLEESDRRPLLLCPVCREKLTWNLGLEQIPRYRSLEKSLRAAGLEGDAEQTMRAMDITSRAARG